MRLRGTGSIFPKKGTRFLQISYYDPVSGKQVQEANGTINRTLRLLQRMFSIAKRDGKVAMTPYFPTLDEKGAVRQGFVETEEFKKIKGALPENLHPLLLFLHSTGCRVTAARKIDWSQIEETNEKLYVHLPGTLTKTKEPLMLRLTNELAGLLKKLPRKGPRLTQAFRNIDG